MNDVALIKRATQMKLVSVAVLRATSGIHPSDEVACERLAGNLKRQVEIFKFLIRSFFSNVGLSRSNVPFALLLVIRGLYSI